MTLVRLRIPKQMISFALCLTLLFTCVPSLSFMLRAEEVSTVVDSWEKFEAALENENATVITLTGNITSPQQSGDDAVVINRDVIIKGSGNTMTLNSGGIVLGGDVTFENITLYFANPVRNAIFANGYTLTLNGVGNGDTSISGNGTSIHLFCGGVTAYNGTNNLPETGSAGTIVIQGSGNELGNIYAGSLDDAASESAASANEFGGSAVIKVESTSEGTIGEIYAHGARESRGEGKGDVLYPDAEKYTVAQPVTIQLYGTLVKKVDGRTGGTANACLIYNGTANLNSSLTATNLSSLSVKTGNLALTASSSLAENASVSVERDTLLDLTNWGDLTVGSFSGGGQLVMGQNQKLTIGGDVTGTTQVAIGSVTSDGSGSGTVPKTGHSYITAVASNEGSFTLLPYSFYPDDVLARQSDGSWIIEERELEEVKLTSFSAIDSSISMTFEETKSLTADFQVRCTTSPEDENLGWVKLNYSVKKGNQDYKAVVEDDGYGYVGSIEDLNMSFWANGDGINSNYYIIVEPIISEQGIQAGKYVIMVSDDEGHSVELNLEVSCISHSYEESTGKCFSCEHQAVIKVDNHYYDSDNLSDAFTALMDQTVGHSVTLFTDVTYEAGDLMLTKPDSAIDLRSHTLTLTNGTLRVGGTTISGTGAIVSQSTHAITRNSDDSC